LLATWDSSSPSAVSYTIEVTSSVVPSGDSAGEYSLSSPVVSRVSVPLPSALSCSGGGPAGTTSPFWPSPSAGGVVVCDVSTQREPTYCPHPVAATADINAIATKRVRTCSSTVSAGDTGFAPDRQWQTQAVSCRIDVSDGDGGDHQR
jgi:hypothetical protein